MTVADPAVDRAAGISRWAGKIMADIHNDMREPFRWGKQIPRNVGSFSSLHDYCDANEYVTADTELGQLALDSGAGDASLIVSAVLNEVHRRLEAEARQISAGLYAGTWQLDYGVIDGDLLDEQRTQWHDRESAFVGAPAGGGAREHARGLTTGIRVKVARRGGETGIITRLSTDNTLTPPRPVVSIGFDSGGHGLNWASDCEPVPFAQQTRTWQVRAAALQVTGFVLTARGQGKQEDLIAHFTAAVAGDLDVAAQAEIRQQVTRRLAAPRSEVA